MLCDRLVCGIRDDAIQWRLLAESDLKFAKAFELAQSMELATAKNAKELHQPNADSGTEVHIVKGEPQLSKEKGGAIQTTCFKCRKWGCSRIKCRQRGAKCHHCGKLGHLQAVCRSKPQKPHKVNAVSHQSRDEYTLFELADSDTSSQAPLKVRVSADGHDLTMEVDTGASCSLILKRTFNRYWKDHDLHQSTVNLSTYSEERLGVLGKFWVDVSYEDQQPYFLSWLWMDQGPASSVEMAQLRLD